MNIKQSQMQNLIIYLLDVVGIVIGYFIMIFLRFRKDSRYYIDEKVFYRLLIETMKKSL